MVDKSLLELEYLVNGKSTRELAKQFKVCQKTIVNWLNKFDIKKNRTQWIRERNIKIEHTLFKKGHKVPTEWREKFVNDHKGLKCHTTPHSEKTKRLISEKLKGKFVRENNPNWKGGTYSRNRYVDMFESRMWREKVFKRDNFTCQLCNKHGCELNAHHIKKWADYEKLRFEVDNGITLCIPCHNKTKFNEKRYESLFNTIINATVDRRKNKNGGLAAHYNSNIVDSIEVLSGNSEMKTRTEGLSKISQGQRIGSEKI